MLFRSYKKFPPLPPSLQNVVNSTLKIDYLGTLAKSQKMEQSASIDRWVGTTVALAEAYPEALDMPNIDELVREQAVNEGVPTRLVNSRAKVKKKRAADEKRMKRAQEIAMATAEGEAAQSVGQGTKAMKEGAQDAV